MYCSKCGAQNVDTSYRCVSCGEILRQASVPSHRPNIPNHLVWAILTTIFCCLPFGIVAIVYAAQVNTKVVEGEGVGPVVCLRCADRIWCAAQHPLLAVRSAGTAGQLTQ
jgi:hypothetical protein